MRHSALILAAAAGLRGKFKIRRRNHLLTEIRSAGAVGERGDSEGTCFFVGGLPATPGGNALSIELNFQT